MKVAASKLAEFERRDDEQFTIGSGRFRSAEAAHDPPNPTGQIMTGKVSLDRVEVIPRYSATGVAIRALEVCCNA